MSTLLIVNPAATTVHIWIRDAIIDSLGTLGPVEVRATEHRGHAVELAADARQRGVARVATFGGDVFECLALDAGEDEARAAVGADEEFFEEELFGPAEGLHSTFRMMRDELLYTVARMGGRLKEMRLDTYVDISQAMVRYLELIKVGDRVLFGKWSGTEVKIDGTELLIMKESDIMGVVIEGEVKKKAA